MIGILDRFEKDVAVILIEEANEELHINIDELPAGSEVNTVFHMQKSGSTFQIINIDEETTKQRKKKSTDLMKKLQSKKKESKFKRR